MSTRMLWPLLLSFTSLSCTTPTERPDPEILLGGRGLSYWKSVIAPDAAGLAWLQIPWIPTLAEGLQRADEEDKPLLLWLMNGHPLGCT